MKQQFSHNNPGWQGSGVQNGRAMISSAPRKIASVLMHRHSLREAWHILQGFAHDIYCFHINPNPVRVQCPCCGWTGSAFLSTANWRTVTFDSRCPSCDSRSRHRGLATLLPKLLGDLPAGEILCFAPEKILLDRIQQFPQLTVKTTDLNSVDVDYSGEDIQELSFASERFVALICNHVLEHVPNDQSAIAECSRILRSGGLALFTIPGDYANNKTHEYGSPDDNGHHRHYGMDVLKKFQSYFDVLALDMHELTQKEFRVRPYDYVFACNKKSVLANP